MRPGVPFAGPFISLDLWQADNQPPIHPHFNRRVSKSTERDNEALNHSPTSRRSDGGCPFHLVCRRCLHNSIRRIFVIVAIKIDDWTEQFAPECRQ